MRQLVTGIALAMLTGSIGYTHLSAADSLMYTQTRATLLADVAFHVRRWQPDYQARQWEPAAVVVAGTDVLDKAVALTPPEGRDFIEAVLRLPDAKAILVSGLKNPQDGQKEFLLYIPIPLSAESLTGVAPPKPLANADAFFSTAHLGMELVPTLTGFIEQPIWGGAGPSLPRCVRAWVSVGMRSSRCSCQATAEYVTYEPSLMKPPCQVPPLIRNECGHCYGYATGPDVLPLCPPLCPDPPPDAFLPALLYMQELTGGADARFGDETPLDGIPVGVDLGSWGSW